MNAKPVYRVAIAREADSTKWQVADTIEVDAVSRDTVPDALNRWISRHGIANGDRLTIRIESST